MRETTSDGHARDTTLTATPAAALLALATLVLASLAFAQPAHAASAMEIHALFLPAGTDEGGDAVLLRSGKRFLLMDAGMKAGGATLVSYLRSAMNGVEGATLDVYVSHHHPDHFGGLKAVAENFTIRRAFLQEREFAPYADAVAKDKAGQTPAADSSLAWELIQRGLSASKIGYLNYRATKEVKAGTVMTEVRTSFSFGDARVEVVGAIGRWGKNKDSKGKDIGAYTNNGSLVAKVRGGGVSFLTCGDIQQNKGTFSDNGGEELKLAKKYKENPSKLKADVMKLSHHGLRETKEGGKRLSNSQWFLSKVRPKVSFIMNGDLEPQGHGKEEASIKKKKVWYQKGEQSRLNARKYGFCYMLGYERLAFKVVCKGGKMSLYRGGKRMEGFTTVTIRYKKKGDGDADFKDAVRYETYYIEKDGTRLADAWKGVGRKFLDRYRYQHHFNSDGVLDSKTRVYDTKEHRKATNTGWKRDKSYGGAIEFQFRVTDGGSSFSTRCRDTKAGKTYKDRWVTVRKDSEHRYQIYVDANGNKTGSRTLAK